MAEIIEFPSGVVRRVELPAVNEEPHKDRPEQVAAQKIFDDGKEEVYARVMELARGYCKTSNPKFAERSTTEQMPDLGTIGAMLLDTVRTRLVEEAKKAADLLSQKEPPT
jgi:hypothetical protein